jgi:hypothetical protein
VVRLVRVQPTDGGPALRALRWTFGTPRAWVAAALVLLLYGTLYLLVAKALVIDPSGGFGRFGPLPNLTLVPPSAHLLTSWIDPAFVLYLSDAVVLAPSVPAILTVLVLGALVGVNGAIAVETVVRRPPACAADGTPWWAVAVLPSFLASFSCCAPTVLLLLGAGAAGAVISLVPFVVPVAGLLLLASLVWSARRLESATFPDAGRGGP